jgi:hypothetical protein
MRLEPPDIACFIYCPILLKKQQQERIFPPLTLSEECTRQAFIDAERGAALKDSIVSPRKLTQAWDQLWWPLAAQEGLGMARADDLAVEAATRFSDYCKYDISGWMYPTLGAEVESQIRVGESVIAARADVVKIDLSENRRNTVLVNFNRKGLTLSGAALDAAIHTIAYAFYSGRSEVVTHVCVDLSDGLEKLSVVTSTFRPEDMEQIRKMLYHVECGIRSGVHYANPNLCKECGICPSFTL